MKEIKFCKLFFANDLFFSSSKEKYLGPYSKQFIDEFYKYKQYEIDILSFLLDIRRYYIQEQENIFDKILSKP